MDILEKALRILEQPVCDRCLGRQFGQLLSGFTNEERGKMLRAIAAMAVDHEDYKGDIDFSNFADCRFHNLELKEKPAKKGCSVCGGLFENLAKWAKKIEAKSKKLDFSTFLIGTKLSSELVEKEEMLWERVGIDYCEPIKAEINREIGKLVEKSLNAKFDPKNPDVNIILDIASSKAEIAKNPLFIYGEYQKLKRGIPQTKWPSRKYRTSVEQIIAKPFMRASGGKGHKLHGLGREDIDARCLAWRPFVLEILQPKKRKLDLRRLSKKIGRAVRVRNLRSSSVQEVRKVKEARVDKTYCAVVKCKNSVSMKDLERLKGLVGEIRQRTPRRVLHRRADRSRRRKLKEIRYKYVDKKTFKIQVRGEAGLYIKELVHGDGGRTKPNISEALQNECICKELDVIKIHVKG